MKKLVQINVTAGWGSTGVIAEEIGSLAVKSGWESWIAYGREPHREPSASRLIRIGSDTDMKLHGLQSRLLDNHGLASKAATRRFIAQLREIQPDLIHLHNIHGYYLNYQVLFDYLRQWGGPVVWTLHDIWPLTGHCAYFGVNECPKWRTGCGKCPQLRTYPASLLRDRSAQNWQDKLRAFTSLPNLTLVSVSNWLSDIVGESFLKDVTRTVIHNGVDLNIFHPNTDTTCKYVIGIANVWESRKGLDDFYKLREILPQTIGITLIGLSPEQIQELPKGIQGMQRTASREELARLYSGAIALVNPTWEDNFPTVNIESLACGTPVITYRTGGSPEAVDSKTGIVVEQGDIAGLAKAIDKAATLNRDDCRARAEQQFNKDDRFVEYINSYESMICRGGCVIAVSSVWSLEKGFKDLIELRKALNPEIEIKMVGVTPKQQKSLPQGIKGIQRTQNREELRKLYAEAIALINPTYGDTFSLVNAEALACGTPVITYRSGGAPEVIDEKTGIVVERGDIAGLAKAIDRAATLNRDDCRARAEQQFNKDDRFAEYITLYESLI